MSFQVLFLFFILIFWNDLYMYLKLTNLLVVFCICNWELIFLSHFHLVVGAFSIWCAFVSFPLKFAGLSHFHLFFAHIGSFSLNVVHFRLIFMEKIAVGRAQG